MECDHLKCGHRWSVTQSKSTESIELIEPNHATGQDVARREFWPSNQNHSVRIPAGPSKPLLRRNFGRNVVRIHPRTLWFGIRWICTVPATLATCGPAYVNNSGYRPSRITDQFSAANIKRTRFAASRQSVRRPEAYFGKKWWSVQYPLEPGRKVCSCVVGCQQPKQMLQYSHPEN
jgi:hypothetical protein